MKHRNVLIFCATVAVLLAMIYIRSGSQISGNRTDLVEGGGTQSVAGEIGILANPANNIDSRSIRQVEITSVDPEDANEEGTLDGNFLNSETSALVVFGSNIAKFGRERNGDGVYFSIRTLLNGAESRELMCFGAITGSEPIFEFIHFIDGENIKSNRVQIPNSVITKYEQLIFTASGTETAGPEIVGVLIDPDRSGTVAPESITTSGYDFHAFIAVDDSGFLVDAADRVRANEIVILPEHYALVWSE